MKYHRLTEAHVFQAPGSLLNLPMLRISRDGSVRGNSEPYRDYQMKYGSVCSGIEAATVAWRSLGWLPVWFAEIDPYCCSLLQHHYPEVSNLGNITTIKDPPAIDVLVGGTPCQSFSINGFRAGLDDARGQLTLRFCELAGQLCPRWIVWENVPNVLHVDGGRAFGAFTGLLAKFGYHLAYRILDLQYFGIPQRRRRLFVVGHSGDWRCAAAVLFDSPPRSETAQAARKAPQSQEDYPFSSLDGACLGWTGDTTPKFAIDRIPTLRSQQGGEGVGIIDRQRFRRLTVSEWERLMGFPDGYTAINVEGKPASDRMRRHALGNTFPVPVVRWIGQRIDIIEQIAMNPPDQARPLD